MNVNTVAGITATGSARNQFNTQTVATTVETALVVNTDAGTTACFVVAPVGGSVLGSATKLDVNANASVLDRSGMVYGVPSGVSNDLFSSSSWDGRPFKVRICGTGTAGHNAAQTLIFNLYQGTSATLGSDKLIGTTGAAYAIAQGASNVSFNFLIEATLTWDATSGVLSGFYTGNIAGGTTSQFVTTTVVPNVVGSVTSAGLSFIASVTLGNAASSTVQVKEFVIDRL